MVPAGVQWQAVVQGDLPHPQQARVIELRDSLQAEAEDYRWYTLNRSGGKPEARSILQEAGLDRQRWP